VSDDLRELLAHGREIALAFGERAAVDATRP
jgi:hypothetical protein